MKQKVRLTIGEPVVVAQADPRVRQWGYCQFPEVERLPDGTIHVIFNNADDCPTAYGAAKAHALSDDNGESFSIPEKPPLQGGVLLPNGDQIRQKHLPSLDPAKLDLPEPVLHTPEVYGQRHPIFDARMVPKEYSGFPVERLRAGETEWVTEIKHVEVPHLARYIATGVFPHQMIWHMRLSPDKTLWAVAYPYMLTDKNTAEMQPVFLTSEDNGETFEWRGSIPYQPLPEHDKNAHLRLGFSEPEIEFMPDGSIICLMRTENGLDTGHAPMYITRSADGGRTWSKPGFYDQLGVWPGLLRLENGVTLACYGRPGLFVRASADEAGLVWDQRQAIIEPGEPLADTCAYAGLLALDSNRALLVYSDFHYPNADGVPVKSILARSITAEKAE